MIIRKIVKFNRQEFFSTPDPRSWITRTFLMLALVIFPLFIAWLTLAKAINEKTDAEIDRIKHDLLNQAIFASKLAHPQYQAKKLLSNLIQQKLVRKDNLKTAQILDRIEKKYPGAFRWVIFDSEGNIKPIPSATCLPGKKSWESLIRFYFSSFGINQENPATRETSLTPGLLSALRIIQKSFGTSLNVTSSAKAIERVLEAGWNGKNIWYSWDIDIQEYGRNGNPKKIAGGIIMLVFLEKLPDDFGPKRAIISRKKGDVNLVHPMMMIKIGEPAKPFLDFELPRNFRFSLLAYKSYIQRTDYFLKFFDWVGATVPCSNSDSPERILVLENIGRIIRDRDFKLAILSNSMLGIFILRYLLFWLFKPLSGFVNSLKPKIIGFFMIAVFLPVVSLLGFGYVWISGEERLFRDRSVDNMRRENEGLDLRFRDAHKVIEKDVFKHLQKTLERASSNQTTLVAALNREAELGRISYYYISNRQGLLAQTNNRNLDNFIKKGIEEEMRRSIELLTGMPLPRSIADQAMSEEMSAFFGKTGKPLTTSVRGTLVYFCYKNHHLYFMGTPIFISGETVYLIIQLDAPLVEKFFVQREFANISTPILGFFSRKMGYPDFPPDGKSWSVLTRTMEQSYELRSKISGEITMDGERFLYYIAPLPSMPMQTYIPVYLSSLSPIESKVNNFQKLLVCVAAIVFIVALLLGLFLAGNLLDPILKIDRAVKLIGEGNLNIKLPENSQDEIGRLGTNINLMVRDLKERRILSEYVSESVLESMDRNSEKKFMPGELAETTVLFCDIRGFTSMTESRSASEIFEMLNSLMGGIVNVIRKNNGRTDKFIGDAIMALFFASEGGSHASRAVRAAIDISMFVKSLNEKRSASGNFEIMVGTGINTGEVMIGDIGCEGRRDLTVIGDTVNLASRLESFSRKGTHTGIILSESVYQQTREIAETIELGSHVIRGKNLPVKIYELVSLKQPAT
ncbi:MAG: adenylate/guanylate cyclase domain-containing protein [Candidatus Riflebacteria bacterium]|nr:adenylate/guanylate cyclase domain-containing protein [Candidatus Riflebacteria bacterium]